MVQLFKDCCRFPFAKPVPPQILPCQSSCFGCLESHPTAKNPSSSWDRARKSASPQRLHSHMEISPYGRLMSWIYSTYLNLKHSLQCISIGKHQGIPSPSPNTPLRGSSVGHGHGGVLLPVWPPKQEAAKRCEREESKLLWIRCFWILPVSRLKNLATFLSPQDFSVKSSVLLLDL